MGCPFSEMATAMGGNENSCGGPGCGTAIDPNHISPVSFDAIRTNRRNESL